MNLDKMIAELEAERRCLDEAINALERLSAGEARYRGRPPRWLKNETPHQLSAREEGGEDNPAKPKRA